jgi:DcuC family C4-dicarboxylate transporter
VLSGLVGLVTFLTGSGVGAFSAFGSLSVDIAQQMNGVLPAMLVPMHLASSVFRAMSPVAGCLIAAALIAGVSPMSIAKRTAIPVFVTFIVIFVVNMTVNM